MLLTKRVTVLHFSLASRRRNLSTRFPMVPCSTLILASTMKPILRVQTCTRSTSCRLAFSPARGDFTAKVFMARVRIRFVSRQVGHISGRALWDLPSPRSPWRVHPDTATYLAQSASGIRDQKVYKHNSFSGQSAAPVQVCGASATTFVSLGFLSTRG